jgi:hypothetical protein
VAPRRAGALGVSLLAFFAPISSKKAAKQLFVSKVSGLTKDSKFPLSLFSLGQEPQRKKLCKKETAIFCAHAARASAFEKAEQNNRLGAAITPL